ncbi:hypothetical protein A2630_02430 [Candidatus Woesebacteria bacterium RIFCSPHIGHO2_01_FULL_44_10]|uniref:Methyltransferase type 11 domain-containing protein n=1 Tax=Candidatus Woesebacteria bacterium RIFCSPLOWO2_01_FULL_44_14 TaxID=1802525 RepID=A0A1F8C0S1_9BACT|nr:MAG: hypothetical protein A2630_02430 [Candidatus Woesebacteria bacterium RIFCSPHIGHO2_01_FULL_44_10]OGM69954.1 MAG: hypothetical protein A2975_05090 [Candidatus Woesebacteria bacterium RIFCSPLOWO2_01_FULL_44_14]
MNAAVELHKGVPPNWYFRSLRENILQRYWHVRRFIEVKKVVEPAEKILDIGSADGVFTNVVSQATNAKKAVGIEVLKTSVDWANRHWVRNKTLSFRVGDGHALPFAANTFDAVFALEVLEHVFEPEKILAEIRRVLKKGGYAVFLVPSESYLFKVVWFLWHYMGRMVWKDTHIQSFSNSLLAKKAKAAGFKIEVDKKFHLGMLHLVKVRKK